MTTILDETLIAMLGQRPTFAAEMLHTALRVAVPAHDLARLADIKPGDSGPTKYRADMAITFKITNVDTLSIVVEASRQVSRRKMYTDLILNGLSDAGRASLESYLATTTHPSRDAFTRPYVEEGRTAGRTEGAAAALLGVLAARGVEISDPARMHIMQCIDLDQLDVWIRRAATADTISDLDD